MSEETKTTEIEFTHQIHVELVESCASDASVVSAAKVSTQGETARIEREGSKNAYPLINYLMKHRHGTPFEHNMFRFFIDAPIVVWREWHRHRIGFSYNEESGRYKTLRPKFYLPPIWRPMFKVNDWKPGRPKFQTIDETSDLQESEDKYDVFLSLLRASYQATYQTYLVALELGLDPGLARDMLPVGIYSACWVTCNARSLMSFLALRTNNEDANHTSYPLYEIEQAALQVEMYFRQAMPLTHKAFEENGREAP